MSLSQSLAQPANKFWSLSRFPNYARCGAVDEVDALSISRADFTHHFVNRNRPCLVRNAVRHWPAFERWQALDYLARHSHNKPVVVRSQVVPEVIGWARPEVKAELTAYANSVYRDMPFHEFLDGLRVGSGPWVADSCRFSEGSAIEPMQQDVGGLPFMPTLGKSLAYPAHRSFLYRDSYTDWHFHVTDETFMAQVVGTKEVLILPPDEAAWRALRPVIEDTGRLYDIDTERFPGTQALQPLRAVVEPGDALYIPVYWWHAVQSLDEAYGATVAATFRTPLHVSGDIRSPIARRVLRTYLFSRYAPLVAAAVGYSMAWRLAAGFRRMAA
ncbi:cupin-like domain-containing protein [Pseudomonas sp. GOM7]|uniref:cupin-like domain-containing protein n=1 Tax=Pseudomonas sp. GOM7 TaxID=2998079 RepID=UPI00227A122C|nr:cupin-like domain-containing protein [Pseudomonas sp. GOM7]WAJ35481.1 cupin-like domain-containing protein [Pseudomonas sp. GOM7]